MKRTRSHKTLTKKKQPATKRRRIGTVEGQNTPTFLSRKQAIYPLIAEKGRLVKLRYVETQVVNLGAAAALFATNGYRANSAFDPSTFVGSPGTPGFNEWGSIYNKYRVMAVKAKCSFISLETSHPLYVGMLFNNATAVVTTWSSWLETQGQPYAKLDNIGINTSGKNSTTLEIYCPLKNLLGDPNEYLTDATYAAAVTASPATTLSFNVFCASYDGATNISTLSCNVRITLDMYTYFYGRKVMLQ